MRTDRREALSSIGQQGVPLATGTILLDEAICAGIMARFLGAGSRKEVSHRDLLGGTYARGHGIDGASPGLARVDGDRGLATWKGCVLAQGAGDPTGFGMQVEHGGFEAVVAQDDLQIAHKGPTVQGVGRVRMAQVVGRKAIQVTTASSLFDGPLDVGFVAAPAQERSGARVAAKGVRGEKPCPALRASRIGVFFGQKSRQGHRSIVGPVLGGPSSGQGQLVFQGLGQAIGKEHDSALVAPGLVDVEAVLFEVEVLDAQVQGFADAQTTAVEEVGDKMSGVTVDVRHLGQELEDVLTVWAMAKGDGPSGAQGINRAKLSLEHVAVEEEQGIKGLILSGGGDAREGQLSQEGLEFLLGSEQFEFRILKKGAVAAKPVGIGFLGVEGKVPEGTGFL